MYEYHTGNNKRLNKINQPVKFLGWEMHGRNGKQYFFWSCNIYFQCHAFWSKSFHMPVRKKKKTKRLKGYKFGTFIGHFQKWQHGSKGVKTPISHRGSCTWHHTSKGQQPYPRTKDSQSLVTKPAPVGVWKPHYKTNTREGCKGDTWNLT